NEAPTVVVPDTGQSLDEGEVKTIDVAHLFRDADLDTLTYSLVDAPDFLSLDGTVLTARPDFDDAGTYEIGVVASDGQASSGAASIVYEVDDATPPPPPPPGETNVQTFEAEDFDATQGVGVFTQGGNRQIGSTQDGEWVRYDAVDFGTDPAATQTLDLRLSSGSGGGTVEVRIGAPDGALLASHSTGNTGGWASYDDVTLDLGSVTGAQDLYFVFRGGARSIMDIDTFTLTTDGAGDPSDLPPTTTPLFDAVERPENSTALYNLAAVFEDPEGAELTYRIIDAPDFVSLSGTFVRVQPEDGDDGTYTITVGADDGVNVSTPWTFDLTVADTVAPPPQNGAPTVVVPDTGQALDEGEVKTIDVAHLFRDPDLDALTYSLVDAPDFLSLDGTVLTARPDFDDAGTYEIGVVASDGQATSGAASIVYEVDNATPPPQSPPTDTTVRLEAGANALQANAEGSYSWGSGVTLTGYERDGDLADVVFSTQFRDHGFGVAGEGSRWDGQIDFYDVDGGQSEKMVIDFDAPVDDVFLFVGMLGENEGRKGLDETGAWVAKDADGDTIGTGLIGPELSTLGEDVKEDGSYGTYPIAIDVDGIASLELTATQFGHGAGSSRNASYGENSSDFNVMALEFATSADSVEIF
ncbi:MAG: carbohydrate-binding protein, partial [Pseudomonadota bacterium]